MQTGLRETIRGGSKNKNAELGAGRGRANCLPNPVPLAEEETEAQGSLRVCPRSWASWGGVGVQCDAPIWLGEFP